MDKFTSIPQDFPACRSANIAQNNWINWKKKNISKSAASRHRACCMIWDHSCETLSTVWWSAAFQLIPLWWTMCGLLRIPFYYWAHTYFCFFFFHISFVRCVYILDLLHLLLLSFFVAGLPAPILFIMITTSDLCFVLFGHSFIARVIRK